MFLGKDVHILPGTITWRSRTMAIVVTVIMFRLHSEKGSNQSCGIWMSALCVMWAMWIPSEKSFGLNLLGYKSDSTVLCCG